MRHGLFPFNPETVIGRRVAAKGCIPTRTVAEIREELVNCDSIHKDRRMKLQRELAKAIEFARQANKIPTIGKEDREK